MILGSNRVSLCVSSVADAEVARSVLARFAKRHGASEARAEALVDLANELSLDLLREATGGRIEAERVGSFIEVRAVSRPSNERHAGPQRITQELMAQTDEAPIPTTTSSSWRLNLALANMDGAERTIADADQMVLRAWCGLD